MRGHRGQWERLTGLFGTHMLWLHLEVAFMVWQGVLNILGTCDTSHQIIHVKLLLQSDALKTEV